MRARSVADFLTGFVLPLVRGGDVAVGPPISIPELDAMEQQLPHASEAVVAVDEARADVLADLVVRPPPLVLGFDELALAAAFHDLLFLSHPRAESWLIRERSLLKVRDTAARFAAQPLAADRATLLCRHALLHNVHDLTRNDLRVSWWTGHANFVGQRPPRRLSRWRGLRRVREETTTAGFSDLFGGPLAAPVVVEILRRTPLTELLADEGTAIQWPLAVAVLRDVELARVVAYHAVRPGEPDTTVAAPARYALAFEALLDGRPIASDVRAVAAFLIHLNVLLAMAETRQRALDAPSALLAAVLAPERSDRRPRGLATFFALPEAAAKVDARLGAPPGLTGDAALLRRWTRHREQTRAALGEAPIDVLAARLARQLG